MPVQLTLRSPKGGRVLTERTYDDGYRLDLVSGWLAVVDRNGSVVAAHAACPGLEGAVVEYASTTVGPARVRVAEDEQGVHVLPAEDLPVEPSTLGELFAHAVPPTPIERGGRRFIVPDTFPGLPHGDEPANPDGVARGEEPVALPFPGEDGSDGYKANLDALRAEVARLTGLLDDAAREADRADRAESLLAAQQRTTTDLRRYLDAERARREELDTTVGELREHAADLGRNLRKAREERDEAQALVELYRHRYGSRLEWTGEQLDGPADARPVVDARTLGRLAEQPRPIEEDPRRPHLDSYPLDAILLTYPEVRKLLALHLETCSGTPDLSRAMREGETPLRLAEVLDR